MIETDIETDAEEYVCYEDADEELKEKILEKQRHCNVDFPEWPEAVVDSFKENLKEAGIVCRHIYYDADRPWYVDLDGAGIEDFQALLKAAKVKVDKRTRLWKIIEYHDGPFKIVSHNSGIYHGFSTVEVIDWYSKYDAVPFVSDGNDALLEDQVREFAGELNEWLQDVMNEFLKSINKEYEYQTSDESVIETIKANNWKFDEEGEM